MTQHTHNIEAFVKLGKFLRAFCDFNKGAILKISPEKKWLEKFTEVIEQAKHHNGWFIKDNILYSFEQWASTLTKENLEAWVSRYDISENTPKTVALIMAGNIPLVGFHDLLAVLITGNSALVKVSSNDKLLIPLISEYLMDSNPSLKNRISFSKDKLTNFDAVIATGSNNTARYFEYYFKHKPNIIRKNRNSAAILTGQETKEQLKALGEDIFRYYGLGCRSVSKLFVPRNYNFDLFFQCIYQYKDIIDQAKYANNYDYNKAVYLMSEFKILDNGFLLLKEDKSYASPIASVFYEYYDTTKSVLEHLENDKEAIQCIVASGLLKDEVPFGETQKPSLYDYADGIDTVEFLLKTS